jgi:hypothetical protein
MLFRLFLRKHGRFFISPDGIHGASRPNETFDPVARTHVKT